MNSALITVIIPVYNVAPYLAECLNSVKAQTFKDYEVIIVNDGSTDESLKIAEEYLNVFSDIQVITQKNQGLSAARNTGFSAAKGDYIFFLDSDDYILPETLEQLYTACTTNEADMSICGVNMFWEDGKTRTFLYPVSEKVISAVNLCALMLSGKVSSWACTKLYKRELWVQNRLEFPVGKTFEDIAISFSILKVYKRIAVVNVPFYQYRIRQSSITGSSSPQKIHDFTNQTIKAMEIAKEIISVEPNKYFHNKCFEAYSIIQGTQLMAMNSVSINPDSHIKDFIRKSIGFPTIISVMANPFLSFRNKTRCLYYRMRKNKN